jgi:hypothetical protein
MKLRPAVVAACATCAVAVTGAVASVSSAQKTVGAARASTAGVRAGAISIPPAVASAKEAIVRAALRPGGAAVPSLRVAVLGVSGWKQGARLRRVGVSWDRVDVGNGSNIRRVKIAHEQHIHVVVLYHPDLSHRSPARCAAEIRSLARKLLPLGTSEIEFGNEAYYNSNTAAMYGDKYAAAHAAVAGMGITLIADSYGDYQRSNGTWSQDNRGGGWMHDVIRRVASRHQSIDAFSVHPYGPLNHLQQGDDGGWLTIGRYHALAVANGVNVPWYVTEVGQNLGGSDVSPPVNAATQAADIKRYLHDTYSTYPFVTFIGLYALKDDATGKWGLLTARLRPRPSYRALVSWIAAHR